MTGGGASALTNMNPRPFCVSSESRLFWSMWPGMWRRPFRRRRKQDFPSRLKVWAGLFHTKVRTFCSAMSLGASLLAARTFGICGFGFAILFA